MAHGFSNRVWADTPTTGTGNVTVGAAKPAHCTPGQAGTQDGDERTWLLEEGNDFEIFRGAYTASGSVVTRGTVLLSQIAGSTGTTRMTLAGSATIREVAAGEDLISKVNAGAFGLSMLAAALVADAWTLLDESAPASAAFRRGNILGAVSQSSGVPTGAIIEQGSNANGQYVRFADGTQMCWADVSSGSIEINTSFFGGFRSTGQIWTFPSSFVSAPIVSLDPSNFSAFSALSTSLSTTACTFVYTAVASQGAASRSMSAIAIGRWF